MVGGWGWGGKGGGGREEERCLGVCGCLVSYSFMDIAETVDSGLNCLFKTRADSGLCYSFKSVANSGLICLEV